jgi:hypothetical protein
MTTITIEIGLQLPRIKPSWDYWSAPIGAETPAINIQRAEWRLKRELGAALVEIACTLPCCATAASAVVEQPNDWRRMAAQSRTDCLPAR